MNAEVRVPPRDPFRSREWRIRLARALVVLVVAVGVVAAAGRLFDDPPTVARLRFDNPSGYDVDVTVAAPAADGVLPIGVARQHCVTEFHEVIDQGDNWVVSFRAQGIDGGDVTTTREQLARDGWQVRLPDDAISRLRDRGAPPPPVQGCPTP